jgi:hypothetical protein
VHALQGIDHRRGHDQASESLVVGRHNKPGRMCMACVLDQLFVGVHVIAPILELAYIRQGELPVLIRLLQTFEEAFLLLLRRDV